MSKLTALKNSLKKFTPAAVGVALVSLAGSASAMDFATEINNAKTGAITNLETAGTALIAVAAVMMGIGIIVNAIKR